jgi:hypothetical protein
MVANFEAEETITSALKVIDQMQQTQDFHRDIGHFNSIVNNANDIVKEVAPHLPPDFAQRWLLAEAQMNPELRERFDNAHNSPADRAKAESYIKRTLLRFRKEIAAQPDPDISAHIMAVTHAVRGASGKAPEAGRPDYGMMSNAAFREHVRSTHGFDPGT